MWHREYGASMVSVSFDWKEARSSPGWRGVEWGANGTWSFSGQYFRPTILHTMYQPSTPLHVSSQVDLYVEDTTLTASAHFNNLPELKLSLNFSANEIRHWAVSNKLPINESKSKVLTITATVEDNRLVNVKSATLLALTINSSLSFDFHIENLYNKLATCIGVLRKIRTFLSLEQRLLFYNTIIFAQ